MKTLLDEVKGLRETDRCQPTFSSMRSGVAECFGEVWRRVRVVCSKGHGTMTKKEAVVSSPCLRCQLDGTKPLTE